jgi:predicted lipid-binding transport protein (Tim44 family)
MADLILSRAEVADKARQTERLLEALAGRDRVFDPSALRDFVRETFTLVQRCWQEREYGPVRERLLPGILARHEELLRAMRRHREINRVEALHVERLEFVHLSCPEPPGPPELTALITFQAKVYFVDDRTGAYTRGLQRFTWFQEFWVFRRQGDAWRLYAIEQSHESDRLQAENRVAGMSDAELCNLQQGVIML